MYMKVSRLSCLSQRNIRVLLNIFTCKHAFALFLNNYTSNFEWIARLSKLNIDILVFLFQAYTILIQNFLFSYLTRMCKCTLSIDDITCVTLKCEAFFSEFNVTVTYSNDEGNITASDLI